MTRLSMSNRWIAVILATVFVFSGMAAVLPLLAADAASGVGGAAAGSPATPAIAIVPAATPQAPTNVVATPISTTDVRITWTNPPGTITNNYLTGWNGASCPGAYAFHSSLGSTGNFIVDAGLTASTAYSFKVSAVNSSGEGALSSCASATTLANGVPTQPTGFIASTFSSTQVNLAWTNPSGSLTDNHVYKYSGTYCGGTPTAVDLGSVLNAYHATGLTASTAYGFTVTASSSAGEGYVSTCQTATTLANGVPSAPTSLTAVISGQTQVNLAWTNPAGTLTDNHVYKYPFGSCVGGVTTIDIGSVVTSYHATGLNPGQTYSFYVTASNSSGESLRSNCATQGTPPAAPGGLTVTGTTTTTVSLSWANSGTSLTDSHVYKYVASNCLGSSTAINVGSLVVSYTAAGLTPSTTYAFDVTSNNSAGESPKSGCVSALTITPLWQKVHGQVSAPSAGVTAIPSSYGNIYNSSYVGGSLQTCAGSCLSVSFTPSTSYVNETPGEFGQTMVINWNPSSMPAGTSVVSFVVTEGVTAPDCSPNSVITPNGFGGVYTTDGLNLDLNLTGDSIPFYAINSAGNVLIATQSSTLGNGSSTGWTFHNVPSESTFCVVMYEYSGGSGYVIGDYGIGAWVGVSTRLAVSPGWNTACYAQTVAGVTAPWCNAYNLQITNLTSSTVNLQWLIPASFHSHVSLGGGSITLSVKVYQWATCPSVPTTPIQTDGALLYKSSIADDNCYINAGQKLVGVYNNSWSVSSFGSFTAFQITGLSKNVEYAVLVYLVVTGPSQPYFFTSSGNVNFATLNPSAPPPPPTGAVIQTLSLTATTYRTFSVTTTATRTSSLSLALYSLPSSDGVYGSVASQTPCTGFSGVIAVGTQTILGTGNDSFIVGGAGSIVAGGNDLNPNATYCLSIQADNVTSGGSYLNMTVYTNPTAGQSTGFTVFSVAPTSLIFQWYIGLATTSVFLSVYTASSGNFVAGTPCVTGGGITFTLVANTTLQNQLVQGANRFQASSLTTDTFYCAALGSYTGSLLENQLYVQAYTQTVLTTLVVSGLAITSSSATAIAFSWSNAASSTALSSYLSVWSLNVAYNTCTGATVANSTELPGYTSVDLGTSVTSDTLRVNAAQGLFANATYCIGIANSNNTLGLGPYSLVLGTFASSGGGAGSIAVTTLDWVIVGVVLATGIGVAAALAWHGMSKGRGYARSMRR